MNPMNLVGLLFDGAQVVVENIKIISVLSANIVGIGILVFWGISANRASREWSKNGIALLSMGVCAFVLASYGIVAISRIWHGALPILSNGLLLLSSVAIVLGLFHLIKKKTSPAVSAAFSSHSRLLL